MSQAIESNMNNMASNPAARQGQKGLTLVEILVALAVSLFLLAGTISVFVSNKQAFRMQEDSNFLQENARFVMDFLGRSIRMADHWGGVESSDIDVNSALSLTGSGGCNQAWLTDFDYGIQGFDGDDTIGDVTQFPGNCIAATDYVPGTDILVVRYADSEAAGNGDVFLRSAVSRRAVLGTAPDTGDLPTYNLSAQDGTLNNTYRVEVWFLRPCSNRAGGTSATACDGADDRVTPTPRSIPTLTRLTLVGTTLTQQAMLEGIEQLQFEYGRDLDGDGSVDRFDTADTLNVSANGQRRAAWKQVISVRVALLARSAEFDTGTRDTGTYYLSGDKGAQSGGITISDSAVNYLRKEYQQTLQIRNRVRS